jgi:hypothetical protein
MSPAERQFRCGVHCGLTPQTLGSGAMPEPEITPHTLSI